MAVPFSWHFAPFGSLSADQIHRILSLRAEVFVLEQNCAYVDPDADTTGGWQPTAADVGRVVSVLGSDGRWHAPAEAWMHGDDGFDRALQASETHYFHCAATCQLQLPAGPTIVRVQRGFGHGLWERRLDLPAGPLQQAVAVLERSDLPEEFGHWVSADLHVHMHIRTSMTSRPKQKRITPATVN